MEHNRVAESEEGHSSTPISTSAITMVDSEDGEEMEEAVTPRAPGHGSGQEWQLIDDGLLSQCGSSPRSLSHKDLEVACETQLPDMDLEVAEEAAVAPFLAPGVGKGVEGAGEALEGKEGASAEMHAAFEGLVDAGVLADFLKDAQEEAGSGTPVPQETEGDVRWGETLMSSPEALLSAHSSYADVSLPEHELAEGEEDVELSEGALLDMLEEIGMDADLDSHSQTSDDDLEDSCLDIPDNGVCSIATGYPMGTPFQSVASRPQSFARLSSELLEVASALASSEVLSSSGSTGARTTPRTQQPEAAEDRWAVWKHKPAGGRAVVLLHQLWCHVKVVQTMAARAGGHVPMGIRRRLAAVLRHTAKGGAHTCVAYGTALLGFWLAWHYYSRTRALERLTASQSHDYDMHVLKVLAINEGLSQASSMPITRHCGFKPHNLGYPRRGYAYPSPSLGLSGARLYD